MPGDEQDHGERDEVVAVDGPVRVVPVDQLVQEPLPRLHPLAVDQGAQIVLQLDPGLVHIGRARTPQEPPRAALEELVVGVRDTEERADHHRRHRQREVGDQLGRRPLPFHRVQEPVHRFLDAGAQRGDPLHGEARDEHPALGVVLGVVDAEQSHSPTLHVREPLGRNREVGMGAVGGQSRIRQQPTGQGVAGDRPDRTSVEEGDPAQRPVRAQLFVPGGRVVGALAVLRERCRGGSSGRRAGESGVLAGRFRRGFRHGSGRLAVLGDRGGAGRSAPHPNWMPQAPIGSTSGPATSAGPRIWPVSFAHGRTLSHPLRSSGCGGAAPGRRPALPRPEPFTTASGTLPSASPATIDGGAHVLPVPHDDAPAERVGSCRHLGDERREVRHGSLDLLFQGEGFAEP